jgi:hypothetical protein
MMPNTLPTLEELRKARQVFIEHEPRDLFYRVASELIKLAIEDNIFLSLLLPRGGEVCRISGACRLFGGFPARPPSSGAQFDFRKRPDLSSPTMA